MRFFVFLSQVALVCLMLTHTNCQLVNPSWSESTSFAPTASSRPGPLAKLFSWFRKPTPTNQPMAAPLVSEQADPLTNADFSNSLPIKDDTDRMISNAISDRILEESQRQQVIDNSPFIKENMDSFENEASPTEQKIMIASPDDRESKNMANTPTENLPLNEALRIVHSSNLDDCVARVICELSCNANTYGVPGRGVFRNLIKLQFDQNVKSDDAKFFRQAAAKGRQIVQGKRDCNECFTIYPSCKAQSEDLVAVSSMFKL